MPTARITHTLRASRAIPKRTPPTTPAPALTPEDRVREALVIKVLAACTAMLDRGRHPTPGRIAAKLHIDEATAKSIRDELETARLIDLGLDPREHLWTGVRGKNDDEVAGIAERTREIREQKSRLAEMGQLPLEVSRGRDVRYDRRREAR